jgi:aquaporin Z
MREASTNPLTEVAAPEMDESMLSADQRPRLGAMECLREHWPEYAMEAALLGVFLVAACLFGAIYEFPGSPVRDALPSELLRRILMGVSLGLTTTGIIYSPWGKQSGPHINPSVTLTFLRLGNIKGWDALFYVGSQLAGAAAAIGLVEIVFGKMLAEPAVRYLVTVPGPDGPWEALAIEFLVGLALMSTVLYFSNHHRLDDYTGVFAALLVAAYVFAESPFTVVTAPAAHAVATFPSGLWTGLAVYFSAPPLGMLTAAELYLWWKGKAAVKCCKLHHNNDKRCIFCGANGGFMS